VKRAVIIAAQLSVAVVFLVAAYPKIMDAKNFAGDILAYDLVGWTVVKWIAVWIPWLEGIAGIMLLIGLWVRPAASLLGLLTVVFAIAKISALSRGLQIDCGCFGNSDPLTGFDVVLDIVLLLGAVVVTVSEKQALTWFGLRISAIQSHPP